ncbi:hypothetical protein [Streptomyces cavernicola]|uniref:Uncharacterized protein n=1 Tax=Streptomyces cavernicola TaxID=3043613 RepID=A0ABT6S503_9ACTN|nr:hypothetical protein [Streptomyces sp. B-S-A6]MDI3403167.1 hypothetical protein [Streptomyces sp. B-S-A6]
MEADLLHHDLRPGPQVSGVGRLGADLGGGRRGSTGRLRGGPLLVVAGGDLSAPGEKQLLQGIAFSGRRLPLVDDGQAQALGGAARPR